MRAVVTGSAGFIGSHLCERLLDEGWQVSGVDSFAATYDTVGRRHRASQLTVHPGYEFIEGDLNSVDFSHLVSEADVVFHLAARPGVRASWRDFAQASNANILATQRVLAAIAENPSTRLVFSSSSSVYGQVDELPVHENRPLAPISPYGVTKASCEALLTAYTSQYEISAVSLRYFTVYGPRQRSDMAFTRWIRAALLGEPIRVFGDGKAIRDFTYVADVVSATMLAGTETISGHRIYNVAGGSPVSLEDILSMLEELTGRSIDVIYQDRALGDPDRTGGDTSLIRSDLGWAPEWSLHDGLAAHLAWVQSNTGSHVAVHPA